VLRAIHAGQVVPFDPANLDERSRLVDLSGIEINVDIGNNALVCPAGVIDTCIEE
jgi:hypothetical protein